MTKLTNRNNDHVWIAYATSPDGTDGFSFETYDGVTHIGIAKSAVEPVVPWDYTWRKFSDVPYITAFDAGKKLNATITDVFEAISWHSIILGGVIGMILVATLDIIFSFVKSILTTLAGIVIDKALKKFVDKKAFNEATKKAAIDEATKALIIANGQLERAADAHRKALGRDDNGARDAAEQARDQASKAYDEARAALKAVSK